MECPPSQIVRSRYGTLLPAIPPEKLEEIAKEAAKRFQASRDAGFTGTFTADDSQETLELEFHLGPDYV